MKCVDCNRESKTPRCSACVARYAKEMSAKTSNSPLLALLFQAIADSRTGQEAP